MDFLNRLYENSNFGIGLFAVICFLLAAFLIVLFLGKSDAKKHKASEDNKDTNTFKETGESTKIEIPPQIDTVKIEEPVLKPEENLVPQDIMPIEVKPEATLTEAQPLIEEEPTAILPVIEPENNYPVLDEIDTNVKEEVEPKIMEPVKIDLSNDFKVAEPLPVEPLIKEEIKEPIIEEEEIKDTYYNPMEDINTPEIKVPTIDFDAIARSIDSDLSSMENKSEVEVTPIKEIVKEPETFSSVYINEPVQSVMQRSTPKMDMPKKIDLDMPRKKEL